MRIDKLQLAKYGKFTDKELVFRLASRIIVMVGGRILVEGTPEQISADPRVREVYLGGAHHG